MYLYEKLDLKHLESFIQYFEKDYDTDKTTALKKGGVMELVAVLYGISIHAQTHYELYKKNKSEEDYSQLNMNKTGKTPLALVKDDLQAAQINHQKRSWQEQQYVTPLNFFTEPSPTFQRGEPREELGDDLSDLESQSGRVKDYSRFANEYSDSDDEGNENCCTQIWRKICS